MDSAFRVVVGVVFLLIAARLVAGAIQSKWRSTWKGGIAMSRASHLLWGAFFTAGAIGVALRLPASYLVPYVFLPLIIAILVSRIVEIRREKKSPTRHDSTRA